MTKHNCMVSGQVASVSSLHEFWCIRDCRDQKLVELLLVVTYLPKVCMLGPRVSYFAPVARSNYTTRRKDTPHNGEQLTKLLHGFYLLLALHDWPALQKSLAADVLHADGHGPAAVVVVVLLPVLLVETRDWETDALG